MKYLLCIDGSASSRKAAEKVTSMISNEDAIIFLSVFPPVPESSQLCSPSSSTLSKMVFEMFSGVPDLVDSNEDQQNQLKRSNKKKTEALKELHYYQKMNIPCNNIKYLLVGSNEVSDTITKVADKFEVDCVVMGSRGMGTIKRLLLGSVSSQVLQMSNRSVFIIR
ncbi:hypothetical protein PPL_09197 [Heterostelium album PN500]|uniref:UspA domain-containing protein n=1 Tax=Heterostelium pallidum (strain ATCC 26659 / Pp 5 / PN500) TaxID=670386 RepID=D3BKW5_HETP5|nr:hypothetical protein PPL_09197 [Heterostelium album PN500]EFA78545.1 hypothetical protein PPL_09197 [Heterostelium album PN500]|eukprot:XP_020430669.1 hypothetical protein PPL_09197 [Heterostelium album PN500]